MYKEYKKEYKKINDDEAASEENGLELDGEAISQSLLSEVLEEDFPEIWKELQEKTKHLSEEEKARRFFEAGALAMLQRGHNLSEAEYLEEIGEEE